MTAPLTIDVSTMKNIRNAIEHAQLVAAAKETSVSFVFNHVPVLVNPRQSFNEILKKYLNDHTKMSMDKSESAEKTTDRICRASPPDVQQSMLDKLVRSLPDKVGSTRHVLNFLVEYVIMAVNPSIKNIHAREVYDILLAEGYYQEMFAGSPDAWKDGVKSSSFIIGKAMTALNKGEVPNPVLIQFVEHWRSLFTKGI